MVTRTRLLHYLPSGNLLDDASWHKRHRLLLCVLALHLPAFLVFGSALGHSLGNVVLYVLAVPTVCLLLGIWVSQRRVASFFVTAGLVYCSSALVGLTKGNIEAHFHFFIIIGFIALYQDWVPFLWNIVFTMISHGIGTAWQSGLIFNHAAAQANPWLWSGIHGIAVLIACVGIVIFWRTTEEEQQKTLALTTQLAEAEINQRKFTSELLVNLARRNQSMLYRQLDIISQLEEKERDPDALAELFRLDHLATRIRRNAESLLVLSGEEPTRVWSEPVRLIDVVRAAIAETEDLDRVAFAVDERMEVLGHTVTDLTHVLAELTENAVRFSPPEANVTIRTRPYLRMPGAAVLTVEDWGVGMRPEDMTAANDLLAHPREVDLSVSQRLGLHVVARLADRHNIRASLTPTPGTGITAVVVLPAEIFAKDPQALALPKLTGMTAGPRATAPPRAAPLGPAGPLGPTGPLIPKAPSIPTELLAPTGPLDPIEILGPNGRPTPSRTTPDIPIPRQNTSNNVDPDDDDTRGIHPLPDNESDSDHDPDWTGWWTPARLPTDQSPSWETAPVYANSESVIHEAHTAPHPNPVPVVTTAALPTTLVRPADSSSFTIIERRAGNAGAGTNAVVTSTTGPDPRLTRRVPQANLAPELRRAAQPDEEAVPEPTPPPDAERARDALSRFQASRQVAQQQVSADQSDLHDHSERES